MNAIKPHALRCCQSTPPFKSGIFTEINGINISGGRGRRLAVKASGDGAEKKTERRSFLTLEEAGLVEISGLSTHERFLCRLTEGCEMEELNAGKVCDWFIKDKLKREQNLDAVLQWDDSEFML
ncbi:uncharacterized protein LOC125196737 isoform X2 [Salvia hispanica]|uniref:uncharacterized protein LOC125196737 isoform X2 n=1 Tax=Salvia hispanica TaxID=49212 RepID=UPI0020092C44|nr:uncharacterized protein LOC125196737 isoform X2 [Salvia hispanica]